MQNQKLLVEFFWDCGRMGEISGLFITTQDDLDQIVGQEVNFGEVLGKHSEVYGEVSSKDFEVKSDDQDFIEKLGDLLGTTISGYNPFEYLEQSSDDDEYDDGE